MKYEDDDGCLPPTAAPFRSHSGCNLSFRAGAALSGFPKAAEGFTIITLHYRLSLCASEILGLPRWNRSLSGTAYLVSFDFIYPVLLRYCVYSLPAQNTEENFDHPLLREGGKTMERTVGLFPRKIRT